MPLEEHCRYRYLLNARGVAASFRYKHLFLCGSLVFQVGEEWQEFFYPALLPWVHYIPVRDDLADAEELLLWARENDELARRIAENGQRHVRRLLQLSNVRDYWRELLLGYAKLQRWDTKVNPDFSEIHEAGFRVVDKASS